MKQSKITKKGTGNRERGTENGKSVFHFLHERFYQEESCIIQAKGNSISGKVVISFPL